MTTRRSQVPFDPYYFERLARQGVSYSAREAFEYIYRSRHWGGKESASGEGASQDQTVALRAALPKLLREFNTHTLLDLPCGDFSWMGEVNLPVAEYVGADLVRTLITQLQGRFANERRRFLALDLTVDPLPRADLLLCRDCLVHLSFSDIARAIANMKRSAVVYLLTTTFPTCDHNEDVVTGDWRPLNLERPPFNFPPPRRLISEGCTEGRGIFRDKSLGLWLMRQLPQLGVSA
jgi:hypothetical protein